MIDVALRFHGNSSLGYNNVGLTPSDPATRISMVFNPSETTGLMLHSSSGGDGQHSLTLSLQNGSLAFATELGGAKEVELVSTATRVIREGTWYQLFATKEGGGIQLSVSPLQGGVAYPTSLFSTSSPPPPSLPPNGTLYLGGSPALVAGGYSGCLDRVVVNDNLIPLPLPDINDGQPLQFCGPRPPSEVARRLETGVWLQGGGSYVQVVNSLIEGASPLSTTLEFRTFSAEGLLLALFSEDMAQRLAVEVTDGRLSLQFSRDLLTTATAQTVGVVNDGEWHIVEVTVEANTAFLLVDSNEGVNATSTMSVSTFAPSSQQLYIGGLPSSLQSSIGRYKFKPRNWQTFSSHKYLYTPASLPPVSVPPVLKFLCLGAQGASKSPAKLSLSTPLPLTPASPSLGAPPRWSRVQGSRGRAWQYSAQQQTMFTGCPFSFTPLSWLLSSFTSGTRILQFQSVFTTQRSELTFPGLSCFQFGTA
jgi:hypothetical protein